MSMMSADILTKPLGGQLFHNMAEAILCKHRFKYLSNRGAKDKTPCQNATATIESVTPVSAALSCSIAQNQPISARELLKEIQSGNRVGMSQCKVAMCESVKRSRCVVG
jgi:hypothetical protein